MAKKRKKLEISIDKTSSIKPAIKKEKLLEILRFISKIDEIKEQYAVSDEDLVNLVEKEKRKLKEILIPILVFSERRLSPLEVLCKYLKEELNFKYHKIAILLNRDDTTVWNTYQNSLKKLKERLSRKLIEESRFFIPVSVFKNRKLSVLESLILHLREEYDLGCSEIAELIARDNRVIWTIYIRARKKKEDVK